MIKITEISEIQAISEPEIREYIFRKATKMMQEYNVENLDNIGCFAGVSKQGYYKKSTRPRGNSRFGKRSLKLKTAKWKRL